MFNGLVPADRLVGCSVHVPAELTGPGQVTRYVVRDRRTFFLGEPSGAASPRVERLADLFEPAGRAILT